MHDRVLRRRARLPASLRRRGAPRAGRPPPPRTRNSDRAARSWAPNVSPYVHFHAVDDGKEIVTPQTIAMDGFVQTTGDNVAGDLHRDERFHGASSIRVSALTSAIPRRLRCRRVHGRRRKARRWPHDAEPAGVALVRRTNFRQRAGAVHSCRPYCSVGRWKYAAPGARKWARRDVRWCSLCFSSL